MIGWVYKKLTEISKVQTGKWDANHATEMGEFKFFTCAFKSFLCDTNRFNGECLILPGNGVNVGEVFYYSGEFDAYQRTYIVNDIHIYPKFLFYHMTCFWKERNLNKQFGSATNFLKIGNFTDYEVHYPSLEEQKRIVGILDEAFVGIDQAIANTEKNLQNAFDLFESYLNNIFTQKGEGWVEKSLNEICEITAKLIDPKKNIFIDLPHLGAGNMVSQSDELVDVKTAREEGLISSKFVFEEGAVLYSKIRPYLMKVCRPNFMGLCSADVYPLMPFHDVVERDFLFYMLLSKDFTDYAIKGSARSGMPKVNRTHLFNYTIHIPSVEKQRILAAQIDAVYFASKQLEDIFSKKLIALKELKKSILQKAFAGELTSDMRQVA